ncbi:MAG TPA: NUDIX hydrolase [Methanosarcina sp.]|nr:NUDIX hydrolase [Methanosarcina sp.]
MDNSTLESVGALIYARSTNRYLFLLRNKTRTAGHWGIAGGKIDDNETVTQALVREIKEETGVDFTDKKFIPLETFTADDGKFVYYTFVVSCEDEFVPMLNNEHRGYCWVALDDHPKPLHPGLWRSFKFDIIKRKIKTLEAILL